MPNLLSIVAPLFSAASAALPDSDSTLNMVASNKAIDTSTLDLFFSVVTCASSGIPAVAFKSVEMRLKFYGDARADACGVLQGFGMWNADDRLVHVGPRQRADTHSLHYSSSW